MERTDTCITVGLRPDYSPYDLAFPDLSDGQSPIRPPTTPFAVATSGRSAAAPSDYPQFLTWFAHRVGLLPARRGLLPGHLAQPYQHASIAALDVYIRTCLFDGAFDPADDRWRALLAPEALARLAGRFADGAPAGPDAPHRLSTVTALQLPRAYTLPVDKCIYTHLALVPADEGRDRLLLAWAQADPGVRALCRVSPRHGFVRVPCIDGSGDDRSGHRCNGELRANKGSPYEGGTRVPFLARWPGHVPAGKVSNELICHVDLLAALATITKQKLPADAAPDSFDISPASLAEKVQPMLRGAFVLVLFATLARSSARLM